MRRISALPKSPVKIVPLLLLLGLLVLPQYGWVRAEPDQQPETLIVLHVVDPDGVEARATVVEGGAFSIEDQATGQIIAFFPTVPTANRRNVLVKVFQGFNSKPEQRAYSARSVSLDKVGELEVSLGSRKSIQADHSYNIEIEAIIRKFTDKKEKSAEILVNRGGEVALLLRAGGDCCISCNDRNYCSNCSVDTACGCCHTPDCSC